MAVIEGFRVQNYRALRDVTLGKLSNLQLVESLSPFTVVIGKKWCGQKHLIRCLRFCGRLFISRCKKPCG